MLLFGHSEPTLPTQTETPPVCFSFEFPRFFSVRRACGLALLVSLLLGSSPGIRAGVPRFPLDEGIRIDLPSNGQLRVENQFGDINITVGKERDVSVSAKLETLESGNAVEARGGGVPIANLQNQSGELFKRSPVVIETKKDLL